MRSDMEHFVVKRFKQPSLEFDGEILVELSTAEPGKERWMEIRIYRTASGKYVTEMVGCSEARGERPLRDVAVHERVEDVPSGFEVRSRHGEGTFTPDLARHALEEFEAIVGRSLGATEMI